MDTKTLKPATVGEIILNDFLIPYDITQYQLADSMGVSPTIISYIINNKRRISVLEAVKLSLIFNVKSDFWLNIQSSHDIWESQVLFKKISEDKSLKMIGLFKKRLIDD